MENYNVTGMSCAACSARVEKAVSRLEGVTSCAVSLLTNSMSVEGSASPREVIKAVEQAGYGASLKGARAGSSAAAGGASDEDALADRETPVLKRRLLASLLFLAALMYVSMGHMMWNWPLPQALAGNHVAMGLVQLLLSAIIMVINQKFFINGFKGLWHRAPNMDTLVALGSAAAFIYSTAALFAMTSAQAAGDMATAAGYMHEFYFESAAMILALITVGKMLEARSKGKTTDALKSLMKLAPETACVIRDGKEVTIPASQVQKEDVFVVRPGESIPVDGVVLEGSSAVNESALTGESIPVDKAENDRVSAGTLNQSGFIRCRATKVGEDTAISQIIKMVSDAAATKAPIAKTADKVSGVFVPIVMTIAAVTTCGWLFAGKAIGFAIARGISVLVISCPCALGLATPVAIMVGSGMGAKNGILFKTAVSLEETGKAQIVVLDKTGTITAGTPVVTDVMTFGNVSEKQLLEAAYSLEVKSEHPLAGAVKQKCEEDGVSAFEVTDFRAMPGNGLMASADGSRLLGGNEMFIRKWTGLPDEAADRAAKLAEEGKTPLFFACGSSLLGIIAVADVIKKEAPGAIKELKDMGIRVVMLTGDNSRTANAIGRQAGVDHIIAGVLPDGKKREIDRLKKFGKVIMTGDGINDAPALTAADIGIAIGAGTDVAIDAADVVLMKSSLSDVPAAVRLSRATLRNVHENLFWAFIYNVTGIPLAAGVFISLLGWQLNPMFAAAAMSLSSFCVVSNALRLNLFNMYDTGKFRRRSEIDVSEIKEEISDSIKEDNFMNRTMKIEGMMCAHCEATVKKALEALDAVEKADVSHEAGTAVVYLKDDVADSVLKKAVEDKEYTVTDIA